MMNTAEQPNKGTLRVRTIYLIQIPLIFNLVGLVTELKILFTESSMKAKIKVIMSSWLLSNWECWDMDIVIIYREILFTKMSQRRQ